MHYFLNYTHLRSVQTLLSRERILTATCCRALCCGNVRLHDVALGISAFTRRVHFDCTLYSFDCQAFWISSSTLLPVYYTWRRPSPLFSAKLGRLSASACGLYVVSCTFWNPFPMC